MHPVRARSLLSLGVSLGLCALSLSTPARAEPPRHTFRLVYVRGPGAATCPDEATLRKDLAGVMHYDPVQPDAPRRVTAIIERRGAELTAIAIMRDEEGHVLWETDTVRTTSPCRVLVDALALAIDAWLGEPKGPSEPVVKTPEKEPTPAPPPPPVPAPAAPVVPPATPTPAPRNVGGYAGLDAMGAFGVTPTPSLGAGFFAGVRLREPALFFELGARATWTLAPSPVLFPNGTEVQVRRAFVAGTLAGCGAVRGVFFCVLGGAGTVSLTSDPYAGPKTRPAFGLVGARIGFQYAASEYVTLRVFGEFEALLAPESPRFNDADDARATSPVMAAVGLGAAFGP